VIVKFCEAVDPIGAPDWDGQFERISITHIEISIDGGDLLATRDPDGVDDDAPEKGHQASQGWWLDRHWCGRSQGSTLYRRIEIR
jgi:hypothetical protein